MIFYLFSMLVLCSNGYKILVFAPSIGYSHVQFMARIADTLAIDGHNVLLYIPEIEPAAYGNITRKSKMLIRYRDFKSSNFLSNLGGKAWHMELSNFWDIYESLQYFIDSQFMLCESLKRDSQLMEWLRNENFHIGISEFINFCSFSIFKNVGIDRTIVAYSTHLLETSSHLFRISSNPSFISGTFSNSCDEMNFIERTKNLFTYFLTYLAVCMAGLKNLVTFLRSYTDVEKAISQCSYVFVNSNKYIEFPRPINQRIVYIGGLSERSKISTESDPMQKTIRDINEKIVLISFGSIAKSSEMPSVMKNAFRGTFHRFPQIHFIWKYEEEDDFAADLPNVTKMKWLPQNDFLLEKNVMAIISHGGINTLFESVSAGKPILVIPLFAEQKRNGKKFEKWNCAILLDRNNISIESLSWALVKILNYENYTKSVCRISQMIKRKPISIRNEIQFYTNFSMKIPKKYSSVNDDYYTISDILFVCIFIVSIVFASYCIYSNE